MSHLLSKSSNANPEFSNELVPMHVWFMDTKHDVHKEVRDKLGGLSIPKGILEKILGGFAADHSTRETHVYVIAHHPGAEHYHVYLGHMHQIAKADETETAFSNAIAEEDDYETALRTVKLNELHIQYRPDWNGERGEPQTFDAKSLQEMLSLLEKAGRKEDFLKIFPSTKIGVVGKEVRPKKSKKLMNVVSGAQLSRLLDMPVPVDKLTKDGKIHASKRKILVKRFGEKNIAEMETRLSARLKLRESVPPETTN